ncbi:hypothetical protein C1H46_043014 [Malus baccata]|uniref:U1-type domain-containing protein n=1 Tax=Malus baccata TaxID=106549 RepID=A0A540KBF0_MALBA|nr:hypothetical protein C1H46_043014 [Malus baccata]
MEFKFRSVDERPPPPSPSSAVSYFSAEQAAFRGQTAALITSTLAAISTQPNFAPPRTPPPAIFRNPNMRLNLDWAQNPRSVRDELIERQLEKEMIREEIIAAEIARRWALEAEVRRELMLEREIAMRRPAGEGLGFDQDRFGAMRFDHRVYHPFDDDRFGFFASRAPAAFDSFTWRRQPEPLTNGFNSLPAPPPTLDLNNKDKLIILAKPDPNLSGVKRKTPPTVSASELPPFGLKKKPKEEWSCALCHVSATSEKGLIHHINGKKHQAKEARLRAQKPSSSNAQSSKKAANFSEPKKINGIRSTELRAKQVRKSLDHNENSDISNQKMQEQGTSKKEKEELLMLKDQCGDVLKNKDKVKMVERLERKEDVKKQKTFKFWCESCKIGAYNLKVWSSHISGKKHIARSQEPTQINIPIASFMASSEASKDAEDTDVAKEAQEKIPTATAISSSEASIKAEDSDAAKEAHQKIPTPTAIPSAEASKDAEDADAAKEAQNKFNGIMIALMRIHNTAVAKETNNSAEIAVADTDK